MPPWLYHESGGDSVCVGSIEESQYGGPIWRLGGNLRVVLLVRQDIFTIHSYTRAIHTRSDPMKILKNRQKIETGIRQGHSRSAIWGRILENTRRLRPERSYNIEGRVYKSTSRLETMVEVDDCCVGGDGSNPLRPITSRVFGRTSFTARTQHHLMTLPARVMVHETYLAVVVLVVVVQREREREFLTAQHSLSS